MNSRPIAQTVSEYYPIISSKKIVRKRTVDYANDALDMLKFYHEKKLISDDTYKKARKEINSAPHDDAVSDIMMNIRRNAKW